MIRPTQPLPSQWRLRRMEKTAVDEESVTPVDEETVAPVAVETVAPVAHPLLEKTRVIVYMCVLDGN